VKAVVDTNVIAYLLLGTDQFVEEAQGLMAALAEAWAPALWEAELANALWMATRHNVLTLDEAVKRLTLANGLGIHSVANRTLWHAANSFRSRPSTAPCSRRFRTSLSGLAASPRSSSGRLTWRYPIGQLTDR